MAGNPSSGSKKWRILCIDDDPDIHFILETSLGIEHEVVTAHDGMEAVALLDGCDADFIICDVRMPEMDGFQTVEAIKRHPDYGQTPVFFLTAETDREMAKRGFETGANLYLTKPFDPMRLLKNIDYFLKESGQEPRVKRMSVEAAVQGAKASGGTRQGSTGSASKAGTSVGIEPKPRILVLCANKSQLDYLHATLSNTYESLPCADALDSLQRLFRYEPDLLILNLTMPRVTGWGMAQMIKRNPRLNPMPILLMDDERQKVEPRLAASLTKYPVLPATASPSAVLALVEGIVRSPDFVVREKHVSFADLLHEEETLRVQMQREQYRLVRQEESRRTKYRKIQDFINQESR